LLNAAQLKSSYSSGIRREHAQGGTGQPNPDHGLISHGLICKYLYILSSQKKHGLPNYCPKATTAGEPPALARRGSAMRQAELWSAACRC
jgi:hypothetical protein